MWEYNNNELYHFGVLGMKWGRRMKQNTTIAKAIKKETHGEGDAVYKKGTIKNKLENSNSQYIPKQRISIPSKRKVYNKKLSEMTNEELKTLTNRLQLEKQYKDLTSSKSTFSGKKFITNVLNNAAQQTATKYVSQYMGKGVENLIGKATKMK